MNQLLKIHGRYIRLLVLMLCGLSVWCRGEDSLLIVGTAVFPPFVFEEDGKLRGFEIELWEAVAACQKIPFAFRKSESFHNILSELKAGRVDVGISGISITREREEGLDFSHSYFSSGISILARSSANESFFDILKTVFSPGIQKIILGMLIFIAICAHLIWYFERGKDAITDRYIPGIFEGAWWTIVTMSTVGYGDIAPKKWTGRIIAVFVIITGIAFFGIVIAELSSTFALQNVQSSVHELSDLRGKQVVTVEWSTSQQVLENLGIQPVLVENFDKAGNKLVSREAEALVFDTPVLKHFLKNRPNSKFKITGNFEPQDYGIALRENSSWRESINRGLLAVKESGEYERIYRKWFDSGE